MDNVIFSCKHFKDCEPMVYMFIAIIAIAIYMCYKGCHGVIKISRKNAERQAESGVHVEGGISQAVQNTSVQLSHIESQLIPDLPSYTDVMIQLFDSQNNSNSPSSPLSVHYSKGSSQKFIYPQVVPHRSVSLYQTNEGCSISRPIASKSINLNDLPSYKEAMTLPSPNQ
ncbi:unnamed protein product [Chironomus riparius]|uniref:Uncharacterized protein n=1 Tax=Chironomus riparius TaxID=315576 RepID=A0A9N9S048_9DIPT|nr:unnamed protein product [Chironomus riparius]